ncbi:MAG: (Fe-S)-binding protein [Bacteroidetes bacterium HGW-Bacteroidetes-6]|jgi:Fe-S oxidoreductase|nr:MAG: (Fe-S)-binding protein [Bacteroidetes bacterium HGW-Bacteroidetes-6]
MDMNFDPFVLPFFLALLVMGLTLMWKYIVWLDQIPVEDRRVMFRNFFTFRIFKAVKESVMECLIHRKIFKINPVLGYMHMSLALGWFLLILMGTIESKFGQHDVFNMPWDPIFFNFFEPNKHGIEYGKFFTFMMDFLLLVVLVAVMFAILKRFWKRLFGMKKTTRLMLADRIALYALWLIFPARWLAESLNAANHHNGGFLTQTSGNTLALFLPVRQLEYPSWWVYSIVLAIFLVAMPFSRYMHILTEPFIVFFRNLGIKSGKELKGFVRFEMNACSRCGICIDKCQLSSSAGVSDVQPAYFIQSVRYNMHFEDKYLNCLLCGRCNTYCPVGIDITNMRDITRKLTNKTVGFNYDYLPAINTIEIANETHVLYFAGCMSHLTPSIPKAMETIFEEAGISYDFVDKDGSICCGRPLMQAGLTDAANQLRKKNIELFTSKKSMILVTSCPICFKTFKEDYGLKMHVMHHSQLIKLLIESKRIKPTKSGNRITFHDPCELGRGSGVYEAPRYVLAKYGTLTKSDQERKKAVCCGGSISNLKVTHEKRELMASDAVKVLMESNPDIIVTACPLCKKTLAPHSSDNLIDIAELVAKPIMEAHQTKLVDTGNCLVSTMKSS